MHWKICTFLKKCLKSVHNKTCLQPSAVQFKQQLLVPWKSKYCAYLRLMCDCCYGWFKCCLNPTPTHFPVTLFELHQKKNPNLKPWWKLEKGQDCQAWSKAQMQITIKKTSLWRTPPQKCCFGTALCHLTHQRRVHGWSFVIYLPPVHPTWIAEWSNTEINGESSLFSEMPGRNKKLQIIQFKKEGGEKNLIWLVDRQRSPVLKRQQASSTFVWGTQQYPQGDT